VYRSYAAISTRMEDQRENKLSHFWKLIRGNFIYDVIKHVVLIVIALSAGAWSYMHRFFGFAWEIFGILCVVLTIYFLFQAVSTARAALKIRREMSNAGPREVEIKKLVRWLEDQERKQKKMYGSNIWLKPPIKASPEDDPEIVAEAWRRFEKEQQKQKDQFLKRDRLS
jgi:hypothetical protein